MGRKFLILLVIFSVIRILAGEVADRKMLWGHYVPWFKPGNSSLTTDFLYNYPLRDVNSVNSFSTALRHEMEEARKYGLDGYFIDIGLNGKRPAWDWDLRPYLNAAKGTDFQIGLCADGSGSAAYLIREFDRMFRTYGSHPNYPKYRGKYVVATYQFYRWSPAELRTFREGLRKAGHEIFLIGNVDPRVMGSLSDKKLEEYRDVVDAVYMFGAPGINNEHPDVNNKILAAFSKANGKMFMPCIHPGYYGAWLKSGNDFYQPFRGLDMVHETWLAALPSNPRWIHLTTWNDLIETALMPRAFTFGIAPTIRAYASVFKNLDRSRNPDVVVAYHREEQPGTLLRIEAMNLPSTAGEAVSISGTLRDSDGKSVFELAPRKFRPDSFDRAEWLIPTADLVSSPLLVPEFTLRCGTGKKTVQTPAVFFVSSWLRNAVTVNVPLSGLVMFENSLDIYQRNGVLSARISFRSPEKVKRAVLVKNDRPVALFSHDSKKEEILLTLKMTAFGKNEARVSVGNGKIVRAVKNFEVNGCPWFQWNEKELKTSRTPRWSVIGLTLAGSPDMELKLSGPGAGDRVFRAVDIAEKREAGNANASFYTAPEMTFQNASGSLGVQEGALHLSLFARKPLPGDGWYVRYELEDGRVAFSRILYPFAKGNPVEIHNFLETPVNLETQSGPTGWCLRGRSEFLTAPESVPVIRTRVVEKPLSLLTNRMHQWNFDGNGVDALGDYPLTVPADLFEKDERGGYSLKFRGNKSFPLRFRVWPGSSGRISVLLNPESCPGKKQSVIFKKGWTDGISINLLADGRVELIRSKTEKGTGEILHGKTPLSPGQWTRLEVVADVREMKLFLNGRLDGSIPLEPVRLYGNCTVFLGGERHNGYERYRGKMDELFISGLPCPIGDIEKYSNHE